MVDPRIKVLGKKIRQTRTEQSLSQEALANKAGVDRAYMGKIERGEKNITVAKLLDISDALDVYLTDLCDF